MIKTVKPLMRHRMILLLILYLFVLALLTLSPFAFSISYFKELIDTGSHTFFTYLFRIWESRDMLLNLILFMPLGFIFRRIELEYSVKLNWIIILITGFLISGLIETAQFFLDRNTNVADITTNSLGTLLGYILTRYILPWHDRVYVPLKKPMWIRSIAVIFYAIFIVYFLTSGLRLNHLEPWGRKYPFILGNEATKDRPWEGELYHVAIYNQALKPSQVKRIYNNKMQNINPILSFEFKEGSGHYIHSDSTLSHSFSLSGDSIHWIETQGVKIQNQIIRNYEDISDFYENVVAAGEFSVVLWMQTDNLNQIGPARIVSSSINPQRRNFTVGQNGNKLQFRVCTPRTGVNGSWVLLNTKPVLFDNQKHHVVFTFNHGVERFFWDGNPHSETVCFDLDYLPQYLNLGQFLFSKFAFLFLLVVPFTFLLHGLFKKYAFFWSIIFTMITVLFFELFFWILYSQPVGLIMLGFGFLNSIIGAVTGECFHENYEVE